MPHIFGPYVVDLKVDHRTPFENFDKSPRNASSGSSFANLATSVMQAHGGPVGIFEELFWRRIWLRIRANKKATPVRAWLSNGKITINASGLPTLHQDFTSKFPITERCTDAWYMTQQSQGDHPWDSNPAKPPAPSPQLKAEPDACFDR